MNGRKDAHKGSPCHGTLDFQLAPTASTAPQEEDESEALVYNPVFYGRTRPIYKTDSGNVAGSSQLPKNR